jgi:hypothetical protein
MKDERVIELWNEAVQNSGIIQRFADLVAAETREECAKRCKEMSDSVGMLQGPVAEGMSLAYGAAAEIIRGMS